MTCAHLLACQRMRCTPVTRAALVAVERPGRGTNASTRTFGVVLQGAPTSADSDAVAAAQTQAERTNVAIAGLGSSPGCLNPESTLPASGPAASDSQMITGWPPRFECEFLGFRTPTLTNAYTRVSLRVCVCSARGGALPVGIRTQGPRPVGLCEAHWQAPRLVPACPVATSSRPCRPRPGWWGRGPVSPGRAKLAGPGREWARGRWRPGRGREAHLGSPACLPQCQWPMPRPRARIGGSWQPAITHWQRTLPACSDSALGRCALKAQQVEPKCTERMKPTVRGSPHGAFVSLAHSVF